MLRIGILASHQGTNFQNIANACEEGSLNAKVVVLICNNSNAPVMKRASYMQIPAYHLSTSTHSEALSLDAAINEHLMRAQVQLVVLAGYMKKLGSLVLDSFAGRIINVHPSLLPRHGGQGYFGMRVHESVIAAGDKETGATVHHVAEKYDKGPTIKQEKISVPPDDTVETIDQKVRLIEYRLLLETIKEFSEKP